MLQTAAEVWRKYVTDGVPASGLHQPDKAEISAWGVWLESLLSGSGGGLAYATRAALFADLDPDDHATAIVFGDETKAFNGLYAKVGDSGEGSWTRIGDLPNSIIRLTVTGGTASAIIATAPETPTVPGAKLYLLTPVASNTAATTIAVNGATAAPIKNAFGSNLVEGSLISGSQVLMAWSVDHYQLLISAVVDGTAILADAVAARDAAAGFAETAEAAASALGNQVHQYDTRALAAAATIPSGVNTIRIYRYADGMPLCETPYVQGDEGGPGAFQDAGGIWWNIDVSQGRVNLLSFGAPQDPGDDSTDATSHLTAAMAPGRTVAVPKGLYVFSQIIPPEGSTIEFAGRDSVTVRQKPAVSGGNYDIPLFKVVQSNVRLLGGFTAIGNIAEDTGEYNHIVQFGDPEDDASSRLIENVRVDDVHGIDVRGDVVYVGGTDNLPVTNVEIGHISGDNILRNIVSVTGGNQGRIKSVNGGKYSLYGVDFEPNGTASQVINDWTVESAHVGSVGLLGALDNPIGRVRFETLYVDGSIQVETVPQYPKEGSPGQFWYDATLGVTVQNFQSLSIGTLIAKSKSIAAIKSVSGVNGDVTIGEYFSAGNCTGDPTIGEFVVEGCKSFTVERLGTVTLPVNAGSILISAGALTVVKVSNGQVLNGRVINRGGEFCEFHKLQVNPGATSTGASFGNLDYPLWDRVQTVGTSKAFSNACRYGTLLSCNIQASAFSSSSSNIHTAISSFILGTFYATKDLST